MIKTVVNVKRTVGTELNSSLKDLKRTSIIVGIPRGGKGDTRKDSPISNSDLGWVHEKGAPAAGIPPRPFLEPGVASIKDKLASRMGQAIEAALKGNGQTMSNCLEVAASEAEAAVKSYMSSASFTPLKPSTIKHRNASRGTASKRPGEDNGSASVRPLINTGALRDAITATVHKE